MASARSDIGVLPLCDARPSNRSSNRVLPDTRSTTPIWSPWASRTAPCSTWSSTKPAQSCLRHTAGSSAAGSRPTLRIAVATDSPSASVSRCVSAAVVRPAAQRLPRQAWPNLAPSSAAKATTRRGRPSRMSRSRSTRTASTPATTPATPSNRPPPGTLSRCDPVPMPGASDVPGSSAIVLPAASTRTRSSRSSSHPATRRCASRSASVYARRVTPGDPIEMAASSSIMAVMRSGSASPVHFVPSPVATGPGASLGVVLIVAQRVRRARRAAACRAALRGWWRRAFRYPPPRPTAVRRAGGVPGPRCRHEPGR